jgi:hypothetical protein
MRARPAISLPSKPMTSPPAANPAAKASASSRFQAATRAR